MFDLTDFDALQIGLASPEKILEWSHGEVKKPETINYRTLKPEKDGLFCERIFGPTKDWECHCGRYKRGRYKGIVCEKCGVEVTRSKVRRERMGHIELAVPVSHIWYFKGIPCRMKMLLDMSPRELEQVLYFASFVVIDPGETTLRKKQILSDKEYREYQEQFGPKSFRAGMGAEAIRELLCEINLEELEAQLRKEVETFGGQKRINSIKRLEVVEAFIKSGNRPEWIILTVLPVIPPDIRPMVQLDGGRFATSDLNDLYRRVINRNNRLKRLLELRAPDIIVRNEKRMLQEAVDALIDNGRRSRPVTGPGNRPLKSLSDMLRGKQGRFRQNLLGKRVDYSGRSVIVIGPWLKMSQCGLPKEMALELFKPFVMKKLVKGGFAQNVKGAKRMVERSAPEVWGVLEEVIKDHPVLLNRAPTLHRLGIQAFEPVLVEGRAIKLHPLVCTAFNADFDGDQMAVHVPLSVEAQAEARFLMLAANNILKPQDGKPVVCPTQDMVIGCYYLTQQRDGVKGEGKAFHSEDEAIMAYQTGEITLQSKVYVRLERQWQGKTYRKVVNTSVGRLIFNNAIPQDLGFVQRDCLDDMFKLEVDHLVVKKDLGTIVDMCYRKHGPTITSEVLDRIKSLGFTYSTKAGITVSYQDIKVPKEKKAIIAAAEKQVVDIDNMFRMGLLSNKERRDNVIAIWEKAVDDVTTALMDSMDPYNNIFMMANSGARGSKAQIRQLAGMRGLMADPSGQIIEVPIRANFREGLSVLEFFISSHGARKGLADTALRTADSGYLTRRLVDVSQDVIVREEDCFASRNDTPKGMWITDLRDDSKLIEPLKARIAGRYTIDPVVNPATGEVIVPADSMITYEQADAIEAAGITEVLCRSVFTCRTEHGVCAKCYGNNLATGGHVSIGEAVGIIAAQAIGEPGTQLTMRTFHTGGVASNEDITQGLPRVEELFEARKPKGLAVITEIAGVFHMDEEKRRAIISNEDGESVDYHIPYGSKMKVKEGDAVEAGQELTEGSVNPNDILRILGVKGVQSYLLKEVQSVYRLQGVEISDKHIEVIIRQMLRKVQVEDAGDTNLLAGELCDIFRFEEENERVLTENPEGRPAIAKRKLLGITKAALATESFLSAASFQETTRVLTEAAIKGRIDPLLGLKENVILGKQIPAGVGLRRYQEVQVAEKDAQMN
ncbi:MAG: DNA-directed RNA polymerase subunit beta' [Eubacteriales bacterium]|jgi:DNA-directed RNA polymerase subunit beta'|nr:DNA-directed RNA polymerase subunit beta' [Clostridiales bacterium]MDD7396580.1 DNA-directed RNA polymerase subunit beta' [Eubacteriales bacterium]MDY2983691.1 DNA-directed RNA polymerase subunit beta' [Eubacteriales bacterium]